MGEYNRYLTNKGVALCAKIEAGLTELNITKIATGSGVYSEGESVVDRTALKSLKQETTPTSSSVINTDTARIRFSITNKTTTQSLDEGYNVTEIGVFALDPDEGEILYTICVAKNNKWDIMPAWVETDLKPFIIVYDLNIKVQDTQNITLNIDLTAYALNEDFVEHKAADVDSEGGAHGLKLVDGKFQVYNNDTWSDAPVETLAEQNKIDALNIKMLGYTVPDEMTIQNYVDEETRTFHQRVSRVDLGSLDWIYESTNQRFISEPQNMKAYPNRTTFVYSIDYLIKHNGEAFDPSWDKVGYVGTDGKLYLHDHAYGDNVLSFKGSLQGKFIYYELETEILFPIDGQEAGYLGKDNTRTNLLNCTLGTTSQYGVTCEYLGDGTYRFNGTNSYSAGIRFTLGKILLKKGIYRFTSCKFSIESLFVAFNKAATSTGGTDRGKGVKVVVEEDEIYQCYFNIGPGISANNLIVRPMLTTDLSATYDDFVPYTGDTGSLNGDVAQVRGAIGDAWNNIDTYSAGDLRIDENGLYRCLIQNSGQKPSTSPTYWEKTSVDGELNKITTTNIVTPQIVATYLVNVNIKERNGIVFGSGILKTGWSGSQVVFTIPAPYRPVNLCFASLGVTTASSDFNKIISIVIRTDGTCSAWLNAELNADERFSFCYIRE